MQCKSTIGTRWENFCTHKSFSERYYIDDAVEYAQTNPHIGPKTITLKPCTIRKYRFWECPRPYHHVQVVVLGHLPITIWALIAFTYGVQIRYTLVCWNSLSITTKKNLYFNNIVILDTLVASSDKLTQSILWIVYLGMKIEL